MRYSGPSILLLVLALAGGSVVAQGTGTGTGGGRGGRGGQPTGIPPRAGGPPQEAPRGTSIIRGVVLAADNGTPVRRAQVRASSPTARQNRLVTTDASGRFEIRELVAGRYTLTASKSGFVTAQYGQRRPSDPGTPIELGDNQLVDKVVIGVPRGSVIAGRVMDEFGEPLANANVTAMRYGFVGGARRLTPSQGRDTTDDLGQFRLFGLPPGEYVVSASFRAAESTESSGEPPSGYAPTYFPGTPNAAEAQRIRVDVGQEQSSVVFALVATRLVRISGSVMNSRGIPITNGNVMLGPAEGGLPGVTNALNGRIERNGVFRINNVPPGRYRLQVRTNPEPVARGQVRAIDTTETARQDIVVGTDDVTGIAMVTAPGARISGTVVVDGAPSTPLAPTQVQVYARPTQFDQGPMAGGVPNAQVRQDWTFEIPNVFDPRVFRTTAPQGWSMKQVTLNGQDITDVPVLLPAGQAFTGLQLVITDKTTNLSGRVVDVRGEPVLDASIVVFPSDERLWVYQARHIQSGRPDQDGRYQMRGLPAHRDYLIVAVQGLEDGQAGDPEFLKRVRERATRFSLNEGETKAVDMQLSR